MAAFRPLPNNFQPLRFYARRRIKSEIGNHESEEVVVSVRGLAGAAKTC
jgi:hypothetical protein